MAKQITPKSTKNEILDAYSQLLEEVQEKKTEEPKIIQKEKKEQETIEKASSNNYEQIVNGIAGLKLNISKELDKLNEQLVSEYEKLADIQKAINLEKKNLDELYQITANADSLAAMLMAQKIKKEEFEAEMSSTQVAFETKIAKDKDTFDDEMAEKRVQWKKENDLHEATTKENVIKLKTLRDREEEEYRYTLDLNRKKDSDAYAEKKEKQERELSEKKISFEKEIVEREQKVAEVEAELKELRTKTNNFPKDLENTVKKAEELMESKLAMQYNFEKELTEKQTAGELALKEQSIVLLKEKIKEQEQFVKELSKKASDAEGNVKDIAVRAIESSSNIQFIEKQIEKKTSTDRD